MTVAPPWRVAENRSRVAGLSYLEPGIGELNTEPVPSATLRSCLSALAQSGCAKMVRTIGAIGSRMARVTAA